jgi:hypothetical protein
MPPLTTLALVLAAWLVLSVPVALVLGRALSAVSARRPVDDLQRHPAVDQVARAGHVARVF